ncbi:hexosyltransferase [Kaistia sp. 32K]|uniref:glycosyltransferase family 4 protein n=1 Tax=Kaistia sp. 32K TaxID=2795690 RepID=UPI0019153433|nr:glycosyltransferase family 4 protein [Kaistia sp. 32K]BCP53481.1 hexosyltransferase [Kaistia sp. 32K]
MNAPADLRQQPASVRVAVVFQRFGPYHVSRLDAAGRYMNLTGIELSGTDRTYAWASTEGLGDFPRLVVSADIDAEPVRTMYGKVSAALASAQPDVVAIAGWSHPAALAALLWCSRHGRRAIVMSDSAEQDSRRRPWRESIKRQIVSLYGAALVGGETHRRYLVALGLRENAIFDGLDVIDNAHFAEGASQVRATAPKSRKQLGLPGRYFLVSSRMIAKKNLFAVLEAYRDYRDMAGGLPWDLVMLGDGRLLTDLRATVAELGLSAQVHFPGFRQYADLPAYYGLAGAFILASSTEQWGLVVNEAMAAGLPVLVSARCGCCDELVRHGINGYRFDPGDPGELARHMWRVAADPALALVMAQAGQSAIAEWSPERFANNLRRAVDHAMATPPRTGALARAVVGAMMFRRERADD